METDAGAVCCMQSRDRAKPQPWPDERTNKRALSFYDRVLFEGDKTKTRSTSELTDRQQRTLCHRSEAHPQPILSRCNCPFITNACPLPIYPPTPNTFRLLLLILIIGSRTIKIGQFVAQCRSTRLEHTDLMGYSV